LELGLTGLSTLTFTVPQIALPMEIGSIVATTAVANLLQRVICNANKVLGVPGKLTRIKGCTKVWDTEEVWFWMAKNGEFLNSVPEWEG
jgi:hypothetical protein